MNDKAVKAAVEQFLRSVQATAQGEIEKALRSALAGGKLVAHEPLTAAVSVASEKIGLNITIYSKIVL